MEARAMEGVREDAPNEGDLPVVASAVVRKRLLERIADGAKRAGITVLNAPEGFGKTTLLVQYAAAVQADPSRGEVLMIDASATALPQVEERAIAFASRPGARARSLVAIDGVPLLGDAVADRFSGLLHRLRDEGCEVLVACTPENGALLKALGDASKFNAAALRVHPSEYPDWIRHLSIPPKADVYGLTLGIPSLVPTLLAAAVPDGDRALSIEVEALYSSALSSLRATRDALYRLLSLLILVGEGKVQDLERCGVQVRSGLLARLNHDYPLLSFQPDTQQFRCLADESLLRLRKDIARRKPSLATRAIRIHLKAGRAERAAALMLETVSREESLELAGQYPTCFAMGLQGHVIKRLLDLGQDAAAKTPGVGTYLAIMLCSLTMGSYRSARSMCQEIRRRAEEVEREIDPGAWGTALALVALWSGCRDMSLPSMPTKYLSKAQSAESRMTLDQLEGYRSLIGGIGTPFEPTIRLSLEQVARPDNLAELLKELTAALSEALHGDPRDVRAYGEALTTCSGRLESRGLTAIAVRVRLVASACRLMAGLPVTDERAFIDAGTIAVRESDGDTQLFAMLCEGWQAMTMGQPTNAQFRGQQVLRLAQERQVFLRESASLLAKTAELCIASRITLREEADIVDLGREVETPGAAWEVALHLSAVRYDAELSAWYSLNRNLLLADSFRPMARLAMSFLGDRAESIRRLLPHSVAPLYAFEGALPTTVEGPELVLVKPTDSHLSEVKIDLFGGFHVTRNGYEVTDSMWRRKKAGVLAARLVLSMGNFVGRSVIADELWPGSDADRARQNLYVTASSLRSALRQRADGPQFLIAQGEGLALNRDFVSSDTTYFDLLSRKVLMARADTPRRDILETCFTLEQIYTGPLYIPSQGDGRYFARMRRMYQNKYIDCMIKGIDAALDDDDTVSASWLVESALKHASFREDLVRRALMVYDSCGRRQEAMELYASYGFHLKREFGAEPEGEVTRIYQRIAGDCRAKAVL